MRRHVGLNKRVVSRIVNPASDVRAAGTPMNLDPSSLPERDSYRLMISAFVPRPIAFVSTRSLAGINNCAPFSYSMGVSSRPMVLALSAGEREGRPKDTVRNILDTREFVVNMVTEAMAEKMNVASGDYAAHISEFEEAGLTPVASDAVGPPRIAESPVNFECRLVRASRSRTTRSSSAKPFDCTWTTRC